MGCAGCGRARLGGAVDADGGSGGPRVERVWRGGAAARGCWEEMGVDGERLMLEAFRDGGPRKRDGGGGR